jgi:hypothetical protein
MTLCMIEAYIAKRVDNKHHAMHELCHYTDFSDYALSSAGKTLPTTRVEKNPMKHVHKYCSYS